MKSKPTPAVCERCGSVYFHQAGFRQYLAGTYSSSVGGELIARPGNPKEIWICICGEPLPENGIPRAGNEARDFRQAVVKAKAHRAKQEPEGLLQELLTELATKKDLEKAQERLANLEKAMQVITAGAKKSKGEK